MNTAGMGIKYLLPVLSICLQLAFPIDTAWAGLDPDMQIALQAMDPEESTAVIITFADSPDVSTLATKHKSKRRVAVIQSLRAAVQKSQPSMRAFLRSRGATKMRSLWLINGLAVTAKRDVIRQVANMPGVVEVRRDRLHHKDDLLMQVAGSPEDNILQVGAPALWALGHFGQGVTIGLMDTGADVQHPDLTANWRGGTNSWLDPYGQYTTPVDSDNLGHGTGVLGIMVGRDADGTTIGMAPEARWIAARLFDDQGMTSDSVIHQIFSWFLDPDGNPLTDDAPDVINGSWGFTAAGQVGACINEFQPDITALNAAGIATVFAAGNQGPNADTSISPANNIGAIAVGAVNDSDSVLNSSSRGPSTCIGRIRIYPDVVAPGDSIKTTDLWFPFLPLPNNYYLGSGTSFSAPHASGALALLAGAFPLASLDNLKTSLFSSAEDLGIAGPDNTYGDGRINVDDTSGAFEYMNTTLGLTPCVRPEISFTAAPKPGSIGQPVTFTATVVGSGGPYTYDWDVDGDGLTDYSNIDNNAVNSQPHTYAGSYTGSVRLRVTEAGCPSEIIVADQWACPSITVSISALPDPGFIGEPVVFSSTVAGGTPPYTYAWDLDSDGSVDCTTSGCINTYAAAFNGNVSLVVTDSAGCSQTVSLIAFTVQARPPQPGGSGGGGGGNGCFINTVLDASL